MNEASRILPHILKRVLPLTAAALLLTWMGMRIIVADTLRREIHDRVAHETIHWAQMVSARLNGIMTSLKNLAGNDLMINALIDTTGRENYLPLFFQSLRIPGAETPCIVLADYRGRTLAANQEDTPGYMNVPWLGAVMAGESFFKVSPEGLEAAVPVLYHGLGEGLVAVAYGPDQVSELLSISAPGMAFAVFDNRGDRLFASPGTPWKTGVPDSGAPSEGWVEATRKIPGFDNLTLVCGEPAASAFRSLRRLDIFFLAVMGLGLTALIAAVYLAVRMVTKPLSGFAAHMDRIATHGQLEGRVSESGPSEFQKLGRSFNRLMEDLTISNAKLQESEAMARAILNASPAAIVLLDREGVVLDCNDTYPARFGITRDALLGSVLWDSFPKDNLERRRMEVNGVFLSGKLFKGENKLLEQWVDFHIAPVLVDRNLQVRSVVVEALDITDRKRSEQRLRVADELRAMEAGRAQAAGHVLHNIGNAITPAGIYTEEMLAENRNQTLAYLEKSYDDLLDHRDDLQAYVNRDERGKRVFDYMKSLIASLKQERDRRRDALNQTKRAIERILEMLNLQQAYVETTAEKRRVADGNGKPDAPNPHG